MFRYILLFLIPLILLGQLKLIGVGEMLHNRLIDYYVTNIAFDDSKITNAKKPFYLKELTLLRIAKWEKHKQMKGETLFSWLTEEVTEYDSWNYYKKAFISDDGRVIDHQKGSVSTSEGQAYAMRRALLMRDKETFDKTYNWAKYNLQHKDDKLFGWKWGQNNIDKQKEIKYEIIYSNSASDADVEIAVELIFASKIWNQKSYMDDALGILNDVWNKETIEIKGERIISAGTNQNRAENIEINPSYFMIFGFRVLAEADKAHDWHKLVDSSYRLTNYCIEHIKSGLPPDVFYINRNTGVITFDKDKSDFSYDAVRVFYRFYIDYVLTGDPRAKELLSKSSIFIDRWKKEGKFYTNYKQDGELKNYDEAIGSIAVILPAIKMYDPKVADEIYQNRIKSKYHSEGYWDDHMDYYAQNLVWLGNWLYRNEENIKAFKY